MSRTPLLSLLVLAAALVAGVAACGSAAVSNAALPASSPRAQPAPARVSLEGRFSYAQMGAFVETVEPMVDEFFKTAYPGMRAPRNVIYVPAKEAGASPCGGRYDGDSYEYCPANDSIYVGQDLLWQFYRVGDAAPVIGLAHEWGHHVQAMRRLPSPRSAAQSVAYENQADCVAGAWAQYADEKGWLEADDDLADVSNLMRVIGSRESRARDHGTVSERVAAFQQGFDGGLKACNAFLPSSPIV